MNKTYFFPENTYNTACSILYKLGYRDPLNTKTSKNGNRTRLQFREGHAYYNESTGTLKLVKYLD